MAGAPIHIFGDGAATRDFLFVDDLCRGIIAELGAREPAFNAFHLASGREVSVKELAEIACNGANVPDHPIRFDRRRKREVERTFANYDVATRELGFHPRVTIEEAMSLTWQWFQDYKPFGDAT